MSDNKDTAPQPPKQEPQNPDKPEASGKSEAATNAAIHQPGATDTASSKKTGKAAESHPGKKAAAKPAQPKRPFPITAAVALVLALGVVAASYMNYSRWQMTDLQTQSLANENAKLRSQLQSQNTELQQQISGLQRQDLDNNLAMGQLRSDLELHNGSLNQLGQQLQALAADKGKDPMLWRLAEVEFLLSVANHRLMLERDVNTALTALQDADRRLETIGDPALIPVRKAIAGEMTALTSVEIPDVTGMALRLSSLTDNIEKLPLVSRERVKTDLAMDDSVVDDVNQLMSKILQDLKGVVTIRRSDEPIEPLLPPDEQQYLAQNLALKLEEARIALLHRNTVTFRENLTDTREWVQRYFDPDSAAVHTVVATVDDLQGVELSPELPDISGSLRELRRWLSKQQPKQRGAAAPAPQSKQESATDAEPATEGQTSENPPSNI